MPANVTVVPVTIKAAQKWVRMTHRHLPNIQGGLFAVGVEDCGVFVGVGIAGNPPPKWQGKGKFVISRVATLSSSKIGEHSTPYCTMIYAALCRAGKALGYSEAWTYTLAEEPGTSLKASGFEFMGESKGGDWDCPSRPRKPAVQPGVKGRWRRVLR